MLPPAMASPFTEPPQSFGTEGLNIFFLPAWKTRQGLERTGGGAVTLPVGRQNDVEDRESGPPHGAVATGKKRVNI